MGVLQVVALLLRKGADGKKEYEIHTVDHKGLGIHYHKWENGRPLPPHSITESMKRLLDEVKSLI